jgi:hypothetical protein
MGRRDARQKINREMKHETKKNGKTRPGQKKGETGRETKKGEMRRKRKTNGEIRCVTEKKWGDKTQDKKK